MSNTTDLEQFLSLECGAIFGAFVAGQEGRAAARLAQTVAALLADRFPELLDPQAHRPGFDAVSGLRLLYDRLQSLAPPPGEGAPGDDLCDCLVCGRGVRADAGESTHCGTVHAACLAAHRAACAVCREGL